MHRANRIRLVAVCSLVIASACAREAAPKQSAITDDFGDTLVIGASPKRIVTLIPTTTEILYAIGAGPRVVGRTMYDVSPKEVLAVQDVGNGMRPNVEAILSTHPDLVVLYASTENRDAAHRLRASGVATAAYRTDHISDMARVTRVFGRLIGDTAAAERTVDSALATVDRVRKQTATLPHPKVFWPLWESPLLSVGGGSFLDELLVIAGAQNIFSELPQPSPQVTFEELLHRDPDLILTGEVTRARLLLDPRWRTLRAVQADRILVVDSTIMKGPSARIGASAVLLARLLHPGVKF